MKKELICIVCPRGCSLVVDTDTDPATVNGNACPKGAEYGRNEVLNPTRTVTSIVRVENREDTMVSVKTSAPVPKDKMFESAFSYQALHNFQKIFFQQYGLFPDL